MRMTSIIASSWSLGLVGNSTFFFKRSINSPKHLYFFPLALHTSVGTRLPGYSKTRILTKEMGLNLYLMTFSRILFKDSYIWWLSFIYFHSKIFWWFFFKCHNFLNLSSITAHINKKDEKKPQTNGFWGLESITTYIHCQYWLQATQHRSSNKQ